MKEAKNISRDGNCESAWQQNLIPIAGSPYEQMSRVTYDCLIIGGGITGLTAALRLQNAGAKTILAEAHTIGFGTSGGTSAHINTFADTTFKEAENAFGQEGAQLFADAINEGFQIIKSNITHYKIDCDYEGKTGYLYAEDEDQVKELINIYEGAVKVGVPVEYVENVPTDVPYLKALKFDGQAQFHPLKYLQALQKAYLAAGGIILENTLIDKVVSENGLHCGESGDLKISAKKVIYATHVPPNINVLNFECAPYRSYVMVAKLKSGKYPNALIYDMQEPYHYLRSHQIDGENMLIAGGYDHKTAHGDPAEAFADLEKYVGQYYDVAAVKYKWSSQYYIPVDGFPYIGQMPLSADGIFCATGFNGNGMMLGSVSGKILSDLALNKANKYSDVFSPSRIKPVDSFSEFVKENADVVYHFLADRFSAEDMDSLKQLKSGTGRVVKVNGNKIAAYRDDEGVVHALRPICTHAGCTVDWNQAEKSWDCPCHGARYDINGSVITGPATKPLLKVDFSTAN